MRTSFLLYLFCGGLCLLSCKINQSTTAATNPSDKTSELPEGSDRVGDSRIKIESANTGQSLAEYLRRIPGVQVRGNQVYVRNAASAQSSDQPLIVVDGNPVGSDFGSITDLINPNDIDYVEVLKDAASLSEYGSRGANGVIRIFMKKN